MALRDLQAILARLFVDSRERDLFFADRDAALRAYALSDAEQAVLRKLDRGQVERFARSLRSKRVGTLRELLPATLSVLGARAEECIAGYCEAHPSTLEPLPDALQLSQFVERHAAVPDWPRNVARAERLRLEVLHAVDGEGPEHRSATLTLCLSARARVDRFDFDMETGFPAAVRGETDEPPLDRCWILIGKAADFQVRLRRINEVTARVLRMCDGTRTSREIVRETAVVIGLGAGERSALAREIEELLASLCAAGLLRTG